MNGSQSHVDFTPLSPVTRSAEQEAALEGCLWFDIDNCLYSKSLGIAPLMSQKIHQYFVGLGIPESEAWDLHMHYYKNYGLAIRGLQQHHPEFDAEDFDRKCDGALPLEDLLTHDDKDLQDLLNSFDRRRVKVMALTNANKPHALRVLRILGVTELFEGVISCQYRTLGFPAKPDPAFFEEAMRIAGIPEPSKHYFVDDSALNVKGAKKLGWNSYLFDEDGSAQVQPGQVDASINSLQDLRKHWKQFVASSQ
ncbi:pyrimidine 5'-nucleotidase [Cystobasidium minutum MCA 4210]|uniref:pyrimidine 5'-nucleotidase n=1 Tax=Cystobasidium minutum MCA 4210 TaxID=1397322 RepID=UPI0034CED3B5|eukprot:jgi/Rhomi1/18163/CE18162_3246